MGQSFQQICDGLMADGIKTAPGSEKWYASAVKSILQNGPVKIGLNQRHLTTKLGRACSPGEGIIHQTEGVDLIPANTVVRRFHMDVLCPCGAAVCTFEFSTRPVEGEGGICYGEKG